MKIKSILCAIILLCFLAVPVLSYSAQVPAKPGVATPAKPTAPSPVRGVMAKLTATPFYVVCDPYPTTGTQPTEFDIFLDGSTTAIVSAPAINASNQVYMKWEIDNISLVPGSNHTIQVQAVNINGTIKTPSSLVSFSWTQPSVPSITTQPANQSVALGQTATFTVVATGIPTPTYQWQRSNDGGTTFTNISGATSASYTTPATVATDNGAKFQVIITNIAAIVTSNVATLTVTVSAPAPPSNIRLSN